MPDGWTDRLACAIRRSRSLQELRENVSGSRHRPIGASTTRSTSQTSKEINFKIKRRFEDKGIEMAYPTQTAHRVAKAATGD